MELRITLLDEQGYEIDAEQVRIEGHTLSFAYGSLITPLDNIYQRQADLAPCTFCQEPFGQGAQPVLRRPVPFRGGMAHLGCHDDHMSDWLDAIAAEQGQ